MSKNAANDGKSAARPRVRNHLDPIKRGKIQQRDGNNKSSHQHHLITTHLQNTKLGNTFESDADQTGSNTRQGSRHGVRLENFLGLLRSHSRVDGFARRDILGVLLHQLTIGRDGIIHDGLKGTATQVGRQGLGLTETRLFHDEKVVGNAQPTVGGRERSVRSCHCSLLLLKMLQEARENEVELCVIVSLNDSIAFKKDRANPTFTYSKRDASNDASSIDVDDGHKKDVSMLCLCLTEATQEERATHGCDDDERSTGRSFKKT